MKRFFSSRFPVPAILLILGVVFGLVYVFLIPPWQHYDEPGHFEYVWLVANRPGWPKAGDYDPAMRRAMLQSMSEHGFDRFTNFTIDLKSPVPNIGLSQVGDLPVYYWLASLPLHFMHDSSLTFQLYASRLVSMILFLATILFAWGTMRELTPDNQTLQWIVPVTLIILPGFTDLMTAVNSDVGAVAAFSLFLWTSVRLIRRGFSVYSFVLFVGATTLCFWTKNDVWLALPLALIVLLFTILRERWRLLAWVLILVAVGICLVTGISWGDASLWYRRTLQNVPTRVVNSLAPLGEHAFRIDLMKQKGTPSIVQPLPPQTVFDLRNVPATLGAWIWSSQPTVAQMQLLCDCGGEQQTFARAIQSTTEPSFYVLQAKIPANARHVSVILTVPANARSMQGNLFYDGLVLVKGKSLTLDPPRFDDQNGESGTWGGLPFTNLLRNSSAEQAGPRLQSWSDKILLKVMPPWPPIFPSDIPASLLDWKGAGWYYQEVGGFLFRTFWAEFGWGNVPLLGSKPYRVLYIVTAMGIAGAMWVIWRRRHSLPWEILLVLGLALLGIWIQTIIRGLGSIFGWAFIPAARYAYPAILPTILVLSIGWLEILHTSGRWLRIAPKFQHVVYLLLFAFLDVLSIVSIVHFYYI